MATRLYLTQKTPTVSPTINAGWNVTTGNAVWRLSPLIFIDRSAAIGITSAQTGGSAVKNVLIRQFLTLPLATQTIDGTLSGQVKMRVSSSSVTAQGFMYFRIVNPDGTIASEVGTLTTVNLTNTSTNLTFGPLTLSSVAITAGQMVGIDLGWHYAVGGFTTITGTATFQALNTSGDFPVDNTSTSGLNPWMEFSQTILFQQLGNGFF